VSLYGKNGAEMQHGGTQYVLSPVQIAHFPMLSFKKLAKIHQEMTILKRGFLKGLVLS